MASNRTREVVDRAKEVGAATVSVVGHVGASTASAVGTGVKKGLATAKAGIDRANDHLEAEDQRWEERKERTDMPGIGADDPLGDLAIRLDRQADFFRELAIDAMRPGAVRGAMVGLVVTLAIVTAGLGLVATWRAFSGEGAIEGLPHLAGAIAIAGIASGVVGWIVERGRAAVAHEALSRAEEAEARLCRVAELIALEKHDRDALVEVLARPSSAAKDERTPA
jgi:hypothetical protein